MEYGENMQDAVGRNLRDDAPRPADLSSLRGQLADCVSRAREAGGRIRDIGDQVFGSRPESVATGAAAQTIAGPATFAELVDDLNAALLRIETGLNRL